MLRIVLEKKNTLHPPPPPFFFFDDQTRAGYKWELQSTSHADLRTSRRLSLL